MKKQFWIKPLLLFLFFLVFLTSCSSLNKENSNLEIEKTAIELGNIYTSQGQYEKALEVYNKAIFEYDSYKLEFNKAQVISLMGNYHDAAKLFLNGFEKNPYKIRFLISAADCFDKAGDKNRAIELYNTVLSLDPGDNETKEKIKKLEEENSK